MINLFSHGGPMSTFCSMNDKSMIQQKERNTNKPTGSHTKNEHAHTRQLTPKQSTHTKQTGLTQTDLSEQKCI